MKNYTLTIQINYFKMLSEFRHHNIIKYDNLLMDYFDI